MPWAKGKSVHTDQRTRRHCGPSKASRKHLILRFMHASINYHPTTTCLGAYRKKSRVFFLQLGPALSCNAGLLLLPPQWRFEKGPISTNCLQVSSHHTWSYHQTYMSYPGAAGSSNGTPSLSQVKSETANSPAACFKQGRSLVRPG